MASTALKRVALKLSIVDPILPLFFKRCFYRLPYWILRFSLSPKAKLWIRNSVYFDEMVFPCSDIDLTCQFEEGLQIEEVERLEKSLHFWRLFFPHIGEVCYYDTENFHFFAQFVNHYEISRDPTLIEKLKERSFDNKTKESAQGVIFLLRWLESDILQMLGSFPARKRKISRSFKVLNWKDSVPSSYVKFEERISMFLQEKAHLKMEEVQFLLLFLKDREREGFSLTSFLMNWPNYEELFFTYFPHHWVGASYEHKEKKSQEFSLSPQSRALCWEQISWELWGLYTQGARSENLGDIMAHIESLKACARLIDASDLIKGVEALEEFYFSLWGERKLV